MCCYSERRIGDLEVALTLDDLGPIVQSAVQVDAAQKSVSMSLKGFELIIIHLIIKRIMWHVAAAAFDFNK